MHNTKHLEGVRSSCYHNLESSVSSIYHLLRQVRVITISCCMTSSDAICSKDYKKVSGKKDRKIFDRLPRSMWYMSQNWMLLECIVSDWVSDLILVKFISNVLWLAEFVHKWKVKTKRIVFFSSVHRCIHTGMLMPAFVAGIMVCTEEICNRQIKNGFGGAWSKHVFRIRTRCSVLPGQPNHDIVLCDGSFVYVISAEKAGEHWPWAFDNTVASCTDVTWSHQSPIAREAWERSWTVVGVPPKNMLQRGMNR